jgi:hypothetical protein
MVIAFIKGYNFCSRWRYYHFISSGYLAEVMYSSLKIMGNFFRLHTTLHAISPPVCLLYTVNEFYCKHTLTLCNKFIVGDITRKCCV